jgi:MSHA pilin protein MshC
MPRLAAARGFTLTELVMTIVIIGILSVIVAPRFMSSQPFETRGFYDEAQAVVRYAQKVAIAQRRTIFVCVAANEIAAISNNDCTSPTYLAHPVGGGQLRAASRGGVTLAPVTSFSFAGLGQPSAAVTITFTSSVAGDPTRQIIVEAETGYVRAN